MSYQSIQDIKSTLESLVKTQDSAVSNLSAAVQNVQTDISNARRELDRGVSALVITDDAGRYDVLTRAADGQGAKYNFSGIVAQWTQEDETNRKERAELGEKWGKRTDVAQKVSELRANIDLHDEALAKVSPEIKQFDETTVAIRAHNEKYAKNPKVQITIENHDSFETLGGGSASKVKNFFKAAWRLMQAAVGYLGPYRAVRIMSKYNKQFGDYYEDAADIAALRENEKKLTADRAGFQEEHNKYAAIGNRMDTLDTTYKGPEGIANGIRGLVKTLMQSSGDFIERVLESLPGEASQGAALATVKIAALGRLEDKAQNQLDHAETTQAQLKDPVTYIGNNVPSAVLGKSVDFDDSSVTRSVTGVLKTAKANAAAINAASDATDGYSAPVGTRLAEMEAKVRTLSAVDLESNQLSVDFSGLKSGISTKVREYKEEQERIRREQEAADRRRREALNAAFKTASTISSRHSSVGSSRPSGGFSVGGGSSGISRGSFSVGGGSRGIRR